MLKTETEKKKTKNMATDTILSIRTNSVLKAKAKKVFSSFGLDLSTGVNMYLNDIVKGEARPTSGARKVPNHIMEKWEKEVQHAIKNGKRYSSVKVLIKDLNT